MGLFLQKGAFYGCGSWVQAVSCKRARVCDEGLDRCWGNQQGSERAQASPGEAKVGLLWTGEKTCELGQAGLSWLKSGNLARLIGLLPRCQPISP